MKSNKNARFKVGNTAPTMKFFEKQTFAGKLFSKWLSVCLLWVQSIGQKWSQHKNQNYSHMSWQCWEKCDFVCNKIFPAAKPVESCCFLLVICRHKSENQKRASNIFQHQFWAQFAKWKVKLNLHHFDFCFFVLLLLSLQKAKNAQVFGRLCWSCSMLDGNLKQKQLSTISQNVKTFICKFWLWSKRFLPSSHTSKWTDEIFWCLSKIGHWNWAVSEMWCWRFVEGWLVWMLKILNFEPAKLHVHKRGRLLFLATGSCCWLDAKLDWHYLLQREIWPVERGSVEFHVPLDCVSFRYMIAPLYYW